MSNITNNLRADNTADGKHYGGDSVKTTLHADNIRVAVRLSEVPRRSVVVTVQSPEQSLTYTVPATSLSNRGWQLLFLHGFPEYEATSEQIPETQSDADTTASDTTSSIELYIAEGQEIKLFRDRLATVVANLKGALTRLSDSLNFATQSPTFIEFAENLIEEEQKAGNQTRAEKYRTVLSRLRRFLRNTGHLDILPCNINADIVAAYNRFLILGGLKPSTIAFYNRLFQALYNKAVSLRLTPDNTPFAAVPTQAPKN